MTFCQQDSTSDIRVKPSPRPGYHGKYPMWIGHKFDTDGKVLPFPGHGIMCMLPKQCEMRTAFEALKTDLEQQEFAKSLSFLPASVWHMTIYEGISDKIRAPNCWPADLPLDCNLEDCNTHVVGKLKTFNTDCNTRFRMRPAGWESVKDGICLRLACVDAAEEAKLRSLRRRLGTTLQLFHPGFDTYSFHMGMAYQLCLLSEEQEDNIFRYLQRALKRLPGIIEMELPCFCTYESMCDLSPQLRLNT